MTRSISAMATLLGLSLAAPLRAQGIQMDPQGSGAILGAVTWLQGTLLGNVATAIAVVAVAVVGLMMLNGRMNWRHGATVVLGLFIVFGAVSIVAGIRSAATGF